MVAARQTATAQQKVRTQTKTADELLSMYRSGNAVTKTVAAYWVNGFISGVMASSVHAEQNGKPVVAVGAGPWLTANNQSWRAKLTNKQDPHLITPRREAGLGIGLLRDIPDYLPAP